jgi:hypothetical protein
MKMKAVPSEKFANKWRATSQAVQYLQQPSAMLNNRSVEGICVVLSVKEGNVHGTIPLKDLLPPGHTTSSFAPVGSILSKRESQLWHGPLGWLI